jgi:acetyl esterase/lipase
MMSRCAKFRHAITLAAALTVATVQAAMAQHEVVTRAGIEYVQHDGIKLIGDLYRPNDLPKAPVVIAVHGGGWQNGSRASYQYWGPFLARNGIAVFTIEVRQSKAGPYPAPVYDVKAAIQFVRAKAADLGVDPDRIGLMGDSSGANLMALVALAGGEPLFSSAYRDDPNAATPVGVKLMVGFYGVYDMLAQWQHDQIARPRDQITEKYLGASPMQNRRIYFESSPISYATVDKAGTRFLLVHGTNDDIADPTTQSQAFQVALNQAGNFVRRIVIPGAGHFWAAEPFENEPGGYGATTAPRLLRFLAAAFGS